MKLSHLALRVLPVLALFAAGSAATTWADDAVETKFTRFVESDDEQVGSHLDTGYATYTHKDTDAKVILYGAVHIADKAYFKKVDEDLKGYDVVLYEGVTPSKDAKPDEDMASIGDIQSILGKALGLSFQKDGIDYKGGIQRNFVHADMTQDQLLEATGGDLSKALPGAGMLNGDMMKQLKPMMGMLKDIKLPASMRNGLKLQMAKQLSNVDMENMPGAEQMQKIIIVERNKVCMKVLDEQLEKRKSGTLAIFYGAAHMKDFHERLVKNGWKHGKVEWNVAWQIGGKRKPAPESPAKPTPEPERVPTGPSSGKKRWL
jgi:hypothetical protein